LFKIQKISLLALLVICSYSFLSKKEKDNFNRSIQTCEFVNQNLNEDADIGFTTDLPKRNLDLLKNTEQEISLEIRTFKLKCSLYKKRINVNHLKFFESPYRNNLTQIDPYTVVPDYIIFRCLVI
jgi:hypothetical protein